MATSGYQLDLDGNTTLKALLQTKLELVMWLKDDMIQEVNCFVQKIKQDTESVTGGEVTKAENIQDLQRRVDMATRFLKETRIETYDFKTVAHSHSWDTVGKLIEMLNHSHQQNCATELRNLDSKLSRFVEQSNSQEEFEKRINLKYQILEDTVHQKNSPTQSDNIKLELKMNKMEQNMQKQLDDLHKELSDVKLNAAMIREKGSYSDHFTNEVLAYKNQNSHTNVTEDHKLSERVRLGLEDDVKRLTQEISDIKSDIKKKSTYFYAEHKKLQREILYYKHLVKNFQKDVDNTKKDEQKERGKVLSLSQQCEEMKSHLTDLEQAFQALEMQNETERENFDSLTKKVENNSCEFHQLREMFDERKMMEDTLFAEIDNLKYIQIIDENDEKLPIGSVVGKLNVGIKALSADTENMNDQLAELQMKFKRGEDAYKILTADSEHDQTMGKDDLTAAVRELGMKFVLMEELVSKKVHYLETLRRNLELANKAVTRRKDLEDKIVAMEASLTDLQGQISTKDTCKRCHCEERVAATNTTKEDDKLLHGNSLGFVFPTPLTIAASPNTSLKQESNSLLSAPVCTSNSMFSFGNSLSSAGSSAASPRFVFPPGISSWSSTRTKHFPVRRRCTRSQISSTQTSQEPPFNIKFTNVNRSWPSPLPTDASPFIKIPSSQVTEKGTHIVFKAPSGQDTMMKSGVTTNISTRHQCITSMREYENESLEELRWKDYVFQSIKIA